MSKTLPNNIPAEQSVLGAIFLDNKLIVKVADELDVTDFFDKKHQVIYKKMLDLDKEDSSLDFTTVAGKGIDIAYVIELVEAVPTTAHIDSHIKLVKDSSLRRQVISKTGEILERGYRGNDSVEDYINYAEESMFNISQNRKTTEFYTIDEILKEVKDKIELNKSRDGGITGLSTGFGTLDHITAGLQPEELIILAARPGMGKSAMALNMAYNAAKLNGDGKAGVAIFSLEMSNDQLVNRIVANVGSVEGRNLRTGKMSSTDWASFETARRQLGKYNIYFDDGASAKVQDVRAKCRKLKQEGNLDFVIIDYLQLLSGSGGNRQEQVSNISRGLKQMARELKIPVLVLSQLSRNVEHRDDKRPVLSDLRESGSIEQDADIVLFLYRDSYYQRDETAHVVEVEMSVAKNRSGESGRELLYMFDMPHSRFTERK